MIAKIVNQSPPERSSQARIIAVRNDRLGGRLGALLNAKRIADDYGVDFSFTWSDHTDVSPELQNPLQLFSAAFLERYRETAYSFGQMQKDFTAVEQLGLQTSRETFLEKLKNGSMYRCNEAMRPVILPWEVAQDVVHRVACTLGTIEFTPIVTQAMAHVNEALSGQDIIAYHIRRGDIIDPEARPSNVLWPQKYLPRVFYEEHMTAALTSSPGCKIVVFSDAAHELRAFSQLSPQVLTAESLLSGFELEPLQRDFMELYSMSRCGTIIAPGASAFSSVAALLGGCKIRDVSSDLTPEQRNTALDRLTDRMANSPEEFAGYADLGQNFPELISYHRTKGTAPVALGILRQHFDRGFSFSYIYDLMSEEYFLGSDPDGALSIVDSLRSRPILTNLANAQSYAWAGLTLFAAGRFDEAARLAQTANWLQPILPITRILVSLLMAHGMFGTQGRYPISKEMIRFRSAAHPRFRKIAELLGPRLRELRGAELPPMTIEFIPFELELRDWREIQSTSIPAAFWNVPNLNKMIEFFKSTYRAELDKPATYSLLGQLQCWADSAAEGAALIRRAAQEAEDDAFTQIRLARLLLSEGQYAKAQALYEKASELASEQLCFRAELGLAKARLGEKKAANGIFSEIASIPHNLVEIHILTADVLRRTKQTRDEALRIARLADHLAPGATRTTQLLRKVLEQTGRQKEAEAIEGRMRAWKRNPGRFSSRIMPIT